MIRHEDLSLPWASGLQARLEGANHLRFSLIERGGAGLGGDPGHRAIGPACGRRVRGERAAFREALRA